MPKTAPNCKGCDHCCDWMTFTLSEKGMPTWMKEHFAQYYVTRGMNMTRSSLGMHVHIYAPCPHKKNGDEKGCKVHGSTAKPIMCMQYDCRDDMHLPPGGNYEKGKDRP